MKSRWKYRAAALTAGAVNGLFGGGGGIPLAILLTRWVGLPTKCALANCVAVIFPLCVVSAGVALFRTALPLAQAFPYLIGGLVGGFVGGKLFRNIPCRWLRRLFAFFLLYGAVRYLT